MTSISINGKIVEKSENLLFGDFINTLNNELASKEQVISKIEIDGQQVSEEDENNFFMSKIGQIGNIYLETSTPIDLAQSALCVAQDFIKKIIPKSIATANHYTNNRLNEANTDFLSVIDQLDQLSEVLNSAQLILQTKVKNKNLSNSSSLRLAQIRFVSAIQELVPAKADNNIELLADILENELPEALREMSVLGIPVLQKIRSA